MNDPPLFVNYFNKSIFPWITHPDERGQREDPIARLHNYFRALNRFPGSPVLAKLEEITLDYMSKTASDPKWHPTVRINAITAIGEVRSSAAVNLLMDMIRNGKLHPAFRVAAMAGLVHLAEQNVLIDPVVAAPVVALMTKAAGAKLHSDEWRWMRGQAADILGSVGDPGSNGEVVAALVVMVADPNLPLIQRGKAARALGKLNYNGNVPDAEKYIQALAEFGSDALGADLPADARRLRALALAFLGDGGKDPGALAPLLKQGSVPKKVHDMQTAMSELQKAASKMKPGEVDETPRPPTEEELKPAVARAKAALDAAAGRKSK